MRKTSTVDRSQMSLLEPMRQQQNAVRGNTRLVDYGIKQEQSDYRVHVGALSQHAYVYPTKEMKRIINEVERTGKYKLVSVPSYGDNGKKYITAKGYPIPLSEIAKIQKIYIPADIIKKYPLYANMNTTAKGAVAVCITKALLLEGLIVLPVEVKDVTEQSLQIQGQDILVNMDLRLQVKLDYRAGEKIHHKKCTGNLFIQTSECNPFRHF